MSLQIYNGPTFFFGGGGGPFILTDTLQNESRSPDTIFWTTRDFRIIQKGACSLWTNKDIKDLGEITTRWYWRSDLEPKNDVLYVPIQWGAKEPQNSQNHRVDKVEQVLVQLSC